VKAAFITILLYHFVPEPAELYHNTHDFKSILKSGWPGAVSPLAFVGRWSVEIGCDRLSSSLTPMATGSGEGATNKKRGHPLKG